MSVTFDLPTDIEQELRQKVADLEGQAKEALAVELFRRGALSHLDLSKTLGLDRVETNAILKRHGVTEGTLTLEDLEADYQTLGRILGAAS